jgi:hypothetical protein
VRTITAPAAWLLACTLLPASGLTLAGQQTKYGISVMTSKPEALAKAKTYSWTVSHPAVDKAVHQRIVSAVDRELRTRGLSKVAAGPSDLTVTYASLTRTDIDLKKAERGEASEYAVGLLIVDVRDPSNRSSLFRVRLDTPIDGDRAALDATIDSAVVAMFEKYPRPPKR